MTPERWQEVKRLVAEAADRPAGDRDAWLEAQCPDGTLRDEVRSLLAYDQHDALRSPFGEILSQPGGAEHTAPSFDTSTILSGRYHIGERLGVGGMGEVFQARDRMLGRAVAIKVLPAALASSSDRRTRFDREIRIIAGISHPHICAVYDAGVHEGLPFLVMEFLAGETVAQRLARGPISHPDAIDYGIQIAEALSCAHRRNIVHRDLKPANIMLTAAGIKVLDFGLAKVASTDAASDVGEAGTGPRSATVTREGAVLGTLHYMAPEQLEGRTTDARSDIFSLGVVLYEMLTNARPFGDRSDATIVAGILRDTPAPVSSRQPDLPPALDGVVGACLAKNPDERWQSAQDIATALRALRRHEPLLPRRVGAVRDWRRAAVAAGLITMAAAGFSVARLWLPPAVEHPMRRLAIVVPPDIAGPHWGPALSPDGNAIAFIGNRADEPARVWMRPLSSSRFRVLTGTDDALRLFWSPDSRHVAFFANGELRRVPAGGGVVERICDTPSALWGGTWNRENVILFSAGPGRGVHMVAASGGTPVPLTTPDAAAGEEGHLWPHFLPDGRNFIYTTASSRPEVRGIYVASLGSPRGRRLVGAWSPGLYAPEGYLIYANDSTLIAHRFDATKVRLNGDPRAVVNRALDARWGYFSATRGLMAYTSAQLNSQLVWVDRQGRELGVLGGEGRLGGPALTKDGARAAIQVSDAETGADDVWVYEAGGRGVRLSRGPQSESDPVWSPDDTRVAFSRDGRAIYEHPANGIGDDRLIYAAPFEEVYPNDWAADGSALVFSSFSTGWADLWVLPMAPPGEPWPFRRTPFTEHQARFSPDGDWIAYTSDESGRAEVYVQAMPPATMRFPVSRDGGAGPMWRGDGRELFFLSPDGRLMAAAVDRADAALAIGRPEPLFSMLQQAAPFLTVRNYFSVTADGQRFLVNRPAASNIREFSLVLNWLEDLRPVTP